MFLCNVIYAMELNWYRHILYSNNYSTVSLVKIDFMSIINKGRRIINLHTFFVHLYVYVINFINWRKCGKSKKDVKLPGCINLAFLLFQVLLLTFSYCNYYVDNKGNLLSARSKVVAVRYYGFGFCMVSTFIFTSQQLVLPLLYYSSHSNKDRYTLMWEWEKLFIWSSEVSFRIN